MNDIDNKIQESIVWENRIKSAGVPQKFAEKLIAQIQRMTNATQINQWESFSRYIDWITTLPWTYSSDETLDIVLVKKILDKNHYGLESLKKRILEYISVLILEKEKDVVSFHAPILLFVGLAGTGKTSVVRSIAESIGRKFGRISFGGLSSPLDLRGLSKSQPESEPGQIIKTLREMQCKNPVILLDEVDRVSTESRSAIMGVLLELLDEVEVEALPTELPEKIMVDVSSLTEVDQTIKVADLKTPSGVVVLTDKELEVVKIGPLVTKEAQEEAKAEEAVKAEAAAAAEGTAESAPATEGKETEATEAKSEEKKAPEAKSEAAGKKE